MTDPLSKELASLRIDRAAPPRTGNPLKATLGIAVALGLVFGAYRGVWPEVQAKLFKTEIEVTEIAEVSPAQATVELTSTGYVVPQVVSKVASKVPGKLSEMLVKQGQAVKAGAILYRIDPVDQRAAIATARAQAAAAHARAVAAQANLAEAKIQADRETALAREGVAPKSTAQDRTARVAALVESAKAAEADAKAAEAQAATFEINLVNFTVRSPITGIIVNKPPQVGEFVGPQPAGIAADMGGVEIADFDSLMVEADIPEPRLHQVKLGAPAEIVLDAFPTRRYRGRLAEVTPKVNRAKATVTVKVAFVDERDGALPDMSARVSFLNSELSRDTLKIPPKTIVPSSAIVEQAGSKVVYVVDSGKVRLVPVSLGPAFGSGFELVKGPAAGTRLVKSPPPNLEDGQRIKERS